MTRPQASKEPRTRTLRANYIRAPTDAEGEVLGLKSSYDINDKRIAIMVSYDAPSDYDQRDIDGANLLS